MSVRKIRNTWWVDIRFTGIRHRKKSPTNSKEGAKDYESLLRQKLLRGEPIEEEKKEAKETFAKFAWNWFELYVKTNNKHSEIIGKESVLRVHLVPFFGKTILEKIDNKMTERYKKEKMKTKLSNKSINNHLTVLKKCLDTAIEWEILKTMPRIKLLKTPPSKFDYLQETECEILLNNANGDLKDMILLGLRTGLRFGEIIALSWEDVNLEKRMLSINKSIAKGLLGSTKSNKNRFIPISLQLYEMFKNRRKSKGFVFIDKNGQALNQAKYSKLLYGACKRSDLRKIGWHVLRHTFASHLTQRDVSLKAVQELLGHSDIQTTMRYSHLSTSKLISAIDVLEPKDNFGQHVGNTPSFTVKIGANNKFQYSKINANIKQKQAPTDLSSYMSG